MGKQGNVVLSVEAVKEIFRDLVKEQEQNAVNDCLKKFQAHTSKTR